MYDTIMYSILHISTHLTMLVLFTTCLCILFAVSYNDALSDHYDILLQPPFLYVGFKVGYLCRSVPVQLLHEFHDISVVNRIFYSTIQLMDRQK